MLKWDRVETEVVLIEVGKNMRDQREFLFFVLLLYGRLPRHFIYDCKLEKAAA